jgi:hypothetical protein
MGLFQTLVLGTAGLAALGIGLTITFAPHGFYAGYGIALEGDPSLLSELRAPGANLAMLGAIIFAGVLRPRMGLVSAALGAVVFLAFAFGRLVSLGLDGVPHGGLVAALVMELLIGGLCLLVLGLLVWRRRGDTLGRCRDRTASA